jgi:uncharacterized protein (DUF1330 family)
MLLWVNVDLRSADLGLFEAYEAKVLPLVEAHGGRLALRARAVERTSEVHLLFFPDERRFEAYRADPRRQALQLDWKSCKATTSVVEVEVLHGHPFATEP